MLSPEQNVSIISCKAKRTLWKKSRRWRMWKALRNTIFYNHSLPLERALVVTHAMPEKGWVLSTFYYGWMGVLASFLVAVVKYPSKCNLGEKGLIWLTGYSPSWQGSHNSRSLREPYIHSQEQRAMNWSIILVLSLLFLFLDNLGIPAGGRCYPHRVGLLPPLINITKILPTSYQAILI